MVNWREQLQQWARSGDGGSGRRRLLVSESAALAPAVARLAARFPRRLAVVAPDAARAERLAGSLAAYLELLADARPIVLVPEVVGPNRRQWQPENEAARCAALEGILAGRAGIFVLTVSSLLSPVIAPDGFLERTFTLRVGERGWEPEALARRLVGLDYDHEPEVQSPGEFARRGGIMDIYSPVHDAPVRIEFFGDEIESMRFFLPDSQRSFRTVEELRIVPRGMAVTDPEGGGTVRVRDYFAADTPFAVVEPEAIGEHLATFGEEGAVAAWVELRDALPDVSFLIWEMGDAVGASGPVAGEERVDCVALGHELGMLLPELGEEGAILHWQQLRDALLGWQRRGFAMLLGLAEEGERERFAQMLAEDPATRDLRLDVEPVRLETGMLFPDARLVLLSEREAFGRAPDMRRRRTSHYHLDEGLDDGMELEEGGYAVHASHGICLYHGIVPLEVNGEIQEVLELEFADEARLYVPLDQAFLVGRYVGGSKHLPALSKLGGVAWKNAREAAETAAWDLAAELLRLEAMRQHAQGASFPAAPEWEVSFARSFPYNETADQTMAIEEVLADMASDKPMDRLLCGDVGYGKTEVAMRAAFRAVANGRQVAVLVPTTVLAQQHFRTFSERMAGYPVNIEVLNRFRTKGEQHHVLERLAAGGVDIVIGTHRLLQRDVHFADLGLLIVDEEQRFGVRHKQKLKQLRASLDILTMTATPIPRTLYFSLSGIRNLSTIMTAPAERLPVNTIVAHYDKHLIRQAVLRELERGGQVFYLHNRVQTIGREAFRLGQVVPEARIGVGHGQMTPHELEEVMTRFVQGEIDVLVCTTIIESGIDIPNANTIVIDRADRFGLAEMYQLRGRVGRYHHQAYAYLLLPGGNILTKDARERLNAIRKYTHLGAGFKLALRDLEIRGAGNILGSEQSGHIAAVGFELYCELLKESVARLEQREDTVFRPVPVDLDRLVFAASDREGRTTAALPADYIPDSVRRVELYRRIARLATLAEVDEMEVELADRFGLPPPPVETLLAVARVRCLARAAKVTSVRVWDRRVYLETARGLLKPKGSSLPLLESGDGRAQLDELAAILRACAR
ncbi:MAG: transcription-repair coupling factor [Lentisphaeria bacterium]|jgi:transcription-repair coupling factor (superfamily II helicase)|nr:transcription-repair coupling factor [Lentisphaeria bacterium]